MAGPLATAYVELRPDNAAFPAELKDAINDAFRDVDPVIRRFFDNVGDDFGRLGRDADDAFDRVEREGRQAFDRVEREANDATDRIGASFRGLGGVIAGVLAGAAVVDQIRDTIDAASDLAESTSKVQVVFGDAAGSVLAFAEGAATAFGQSTRQALEATGTFGNLLRAVGLSEEQAAEFSTTMAGLASDLASFNNTSVDDALNALRSGLVGETEPLKRFGVNLNEATLRAEALALGLEVGTGTLSSATKAQAAYSLILKQTSLAQGDFARTAGGLANQQRILTAQIDNLRSRIGQALLPAALAVVSSLNRRVIPAVEATADTLGDILGPAIDGAGDLLRDLADGIEEIVDVLLFGADPTGLAAELAALVGAAGDADLIAGLAGILDDVAGAVGRARDGAAGAAEILTGSLREAFSGSTLDIQAYLRDGLDLLVGAYDAMGPAVEEINRHLAEQRDILVPAAAAAGSFVAAFATYVQISRSVSAVTSALQLLGPALGAALAPLVANPAGLIVAGIVALGAAVTAAYFEIEPFRNAVDATARVIRDVAVDAFGALVDAARTVGSALADAASAVGGFLEDVGSAASDGLQAAGDAFRGVGDFLYRNLIEPLEPIAEWIDENVISTFAAAIDFFDALAERIGDVAETIAGGLQLAAELIEPALDVIAGQLELVAGIASDVLGGAFRTAGRVVVAVLGPVVTQMRAAARVASVVFGGAFDAAALAVRTAFRTIETVIQNALAVIRGIFEVGAGLLRGDFAAVWDGLVSIVVEPLSNVRDLVVETFDDILGFISGLPDRLVDVGRNLLTGFVDTIGSSLTGIRDLASETVDEIVGFFSGLPTRLLEYVTTIGDAARELGGTIVGKLLEGLGALGGEVTELAGEMLDAVAELGTGLINGVIQAMNDMLPNEIGRVEVRGVTIFPGLNLPDNPIPELANGIITDGPMRAVIGEAGREVLIPLERPRRAAELARESGLLDVLGLSRLVEQFAAANGGPRFVLEAGAMPIVAPSPVETSVEVIRKMRTLPFLMGATAA